MKIFNVLLVSLILLNVADIVTTFYIFELGGVESNPFFMNMNEDGISITNLLTKFSFIPAGGFLLYYTKKRAVKENSKAANVLIVAILRILVLWYLVVVCNNIFCIIYSFRY